MNYLNPVMGMVLIAVAIAAAMVWMDPAAAEKLALRLRARAAGLRASRAAYDEARQIVLRRGLEDAY